MSITERRKPQSTIVLVALCNYMVGKGLVKPNNNLYEVCVKEMAANEEFLTGHILTSGLFIVGDIPAEHANDPIIATYDYSLPVKLNLHLNNLGKNAYKTELKDARCYKLPLPEMFSLTEENYITFMAKTKAPSGDMPKVLPALPDSDEKNVTDFLRIQPDLVNTIPVKSTGAATRTGPVASNKIDPDILLEKVISSETNRRKRVQYTASEEIEIESTLITEYDTKELFEGNLKMFDTIEFRLNEDAVGGFLPLTYGHGINTSKLLLKSDILARTIRVTMDTELPIEELKTLVGIIDSFEDLGVSMHEMSTQKAKYKDVPYITDNMTYKVFG